VGAGVEDWVQGLGVQLDDNDDFTAVTSPPMPSVRYRKTLDDFSTGKIHETYASPSRIREDDQGRDVGMIQDGCRVLGTELFLPFGLTSWLCADTLY
jgi:hypothetical protein